MKDLVFIEEAPSAAEYLDLRKTAGWGGFDPDAVAIGLSNSLYCISVRNNQKNLIGFGRVIGDGAMTFYIQDILVKKDLQSTGIGSQIMKRIMDYLSIKACDNAIVGLLSAKGKESFYKKFGFISRPNKDYGCGMFLNWKSGV